MVCRPGGRVCDRHTPRLPGTKRLVRVCAINTEARRRRGTENCLYLYLPLCGSVTQRLRVKTKTEGHVLTARAERSRERYSAAERCPAGLPAMGSPIGMGRAAVRKPRRN